MAERPHKLTDEEIGRLASAEIQSATTYDGTDFQKDRARAMQYYRGEMKDLENEEGLSEAVSHDVQDVIGWILPGLMRVFFSSDELGQYEPENEEDEQGAKQATDYANYIIMKECDGYQTFWDVFHDTLLHANGVVKHWWEDSEHVSVHMATGLDDDQYAELVNSDEIEIIAHREDQVPVPPPSDEELIDLMQQHMPQTPQPPQQPMPPGGPPSPGAQPGAPSAPGQPPQPPPTNIAAAVAGGINGQTAPGGGPGAAPMPPGLPTGMNGALPMPGQSPLPPAPQMQTMHSVKVRRTQKIGQLKIAAMPPEEFLINVQARDIARARMTGHRMTKTRSELIEAGYDEDLVNKLPATSGVPGFGNLPQIRMDRAVTYPAYPGLDKSMEEVEITEVYMKMDADGDGVAEMMRIVMGDPNSNVLLDAELWEDEVPFTDFVAERVPHRWQGRSVFNDTEDIQRIKSTLLRQFLDNLYHANIPDRAVNIDRIANPDALLDRKIGNNIHVDGDPQGAIMDLQVPFVAKEALTGLEYMDQIVERRTGVSRATMALDLDALQNQTATAVNAAQSAAYSKIELIARNFAEMGFQRFFECILKLIVAHQDGPRRIKIKKRWVTMDPGSWNANMKFNVNVGLGSGSRDRDAQILMQIAAKQEQINMQMGPDNPLCGIDKYANTLRRLVQMALPSGEPDLFFNEIEPQQVQAWLAQKQQNQPPNPDMLKAQAAQQKAQADIQIKQQKGQADAQIASQKAQLDFASTQQKSQADLQTNREKNAMDMTAQREKNQMQMQLDAEKAAQDLQQQREAAMLDAELKRQEMLIEASLTAQSNRMQAQNADAHSRRMADVNIQNQRVKQKPKG